MANENTNQSFPSLPIINIDEDPDNANWLRILAQRKTEDSPVADSSLSSAPWDGDAARFTPQQWRASCLVDTDEGAPDAKSRYKLPVREPGGAYNRAEMGAAAAALAGARGGSMNIPASAKKSAAKKLSSLYNRFNLPIPPSLKSMAS